LYVAIKKKCTKGIAFSKKNPQAKGNFQKENSLHSKLKKLNLKNGNSTQKCEKLKRDLLKEKAECGHQTN
jgi:hypothetical protein